MYSSSGEFHGGAMARTGRRPGASGTREAILDAARRAFAEYGYERTTIRGVAAAAGVDPALVHHYFGSKHGLFVAAVQLPVNPVEALSTLLAGDREPSGEGMARMFLSLWDQTADRSPLMALVRSAISDDRAAAMLREFLRTEIFGRLARQLHEPDAELRLALVASQIFGLIMARYIVELEPLASAPAPAVAAAVGPTLQRYLTGRID
jgi:AcrR family transcriptional regulator